MATTIDEGAASVIQLAFRKIRKIQSLNEKLTNTMTVEVTQVLKTFAYVEKATFAETQRCIFVDSTFRDSMTQLIAALPGDPNIADNNVAKKVRALCTATMISRFPEETLLVDDDTLSAEAVKCRDCAVIVVRSVRRLCQTVVAVDCDSSCSTCDDKRVVHPRRFRNALLCQRFAYRRYIDAFEKWKRRDNDNLIAAAESGFMQCYEIYLAAKATVPVVTLKDSGDNDGSTLLASAEAQLHKMRLALTRLLGKGAAVTATSRIEELCARVEASFSASTATASADRSRAPPVTGSDAAAIARIRSAHSSTVEATAGEVTGVGANTAASTTAAATALSAPESMGGGTLQVLNALSRLAGSFTSPVSSIRACVFRCNYILDLTTMYDAFYHCIISSRRHSLQMRTLRLWSTK
jgi:hypothetical protein